MCTTAETENVLAFTVLMQGHQVSRNEQLEISKKKKKALNSEDRTNPVLDYPVFSCTARVQHLAPGFRFLTWNHSLPPPALLRCQEITSVSSLVAPSRNLTPQEKENNPP